MKKIIAGLIMVIMMFSLTACGSKARQESVKPEESQDVITTDAKTLVVYFSWSGNTKKAAENIKEKTNADIFRIITKDAYPDGYDDVVDQAKQEQKDKVRPEIEGKIDNLSQYDTIFVGYPNWWYDMPMVLYTFFDEYDLSEKTIVPFCTHGGSGLSDTVESIKDLEPNAVVLEGLAIKDTEVDESDADINEWLKNLNIN